MQREKTALFQVTENIKMKDDLVANTFFAKKKKVDSIIAMSYIFAAFKFDF